MKIDMHVHTIYSDGEKSPKEILEMCHKQNIKIISITDHNNIEGVKIAIQTNPYKDMVVIPGIEFSASSSMVAGQVHILGYNMNLNDTELNSITKLIMQSNKDRIKYAIQVLNEDFGITFDHEDVEEILSSSIGNIGRPELAKLLVKNGYVNDVSQAFSTYLVAIKDKIDKKRIKLSEKECIKYIKDAGGEAFLAHPFTIEYSSNEELKNYIRCLKGLGISGIEVYHSLINPKLSEMLNQFAEEFNLLTSAGSDYHGPFVKPKVNLGKGNNGYELNSKDVTCIEKFKINIPENSKSVQIYANVTKPKAVLWKKRIEDMLRKKEYTLTEKDSDYVIGIGGDGTLIKWLNSVSYDTKASYIGINCGTLGFLQDFDVEDVEKNFDNIVKSKSENMNLLEINIVQNNTMFDFYAINEFKLCGLDFKALRCNVTIKSKAEKQLLEKFVGTGLIFSTSVGSTANNLSAGGAIMFPGDNLIQLTHCESISNSKTKCFKNSLIIPNKNEIIILPFKNDKISVVADGIKVFEGDYDRIEIKFSEKYIPCKKNKNINFVEKLRSKLL